MKMFLASVILFLSSVTAFASESLPELFDVPSFELTDQNTKPVKDSDLTGKVWIADFFYTSCLHECLMMTSKLQNLQNKVKDLKGIHFVSISTDPKTDTPKVFKKYIKDHKIEDSNWFFLRGDKKLITTLASKGFKMAANEKSAVHSQKFVLIDQKNKIRGYYDSEEKNILEKLEADIRTLSK